jgi:hypothetical protein
MLSSRNHQLEHKEYHTITLFKNYKTTMAITQLSACLVTSRQVLTIKPYCPYSALLGVNGFQAV